MHGCCWTRKNASELAKKDLLDPDRLRNYDEHASQEAAALTNLPREAWQPKHITQQMPGMSKMPQQLVISQRPSDGCASCLQFMALQAGAMLQTQ